MNRPPPTDEVVGFLEKYSPETLNSLREKYPGRDELELLRAGRIGGETSTATKLRSELALEGLKAAVQVCKEKIKTLRDKLALANKLQLFGQVTTIIGGSSIFATLQLDQSTSKFWTYVAASLTLIGALLPPSIKFLRGTLDASGDLFNLYTKLIECSLKARRLQQELESWIASGFEGDTRFDLITSTNEVCDDIERALSGI